MARFALETVIAAPPTAVFTASLDPELHLRSMAAHSETMLEAPAGGVFTEGSTVTWRARHFGVSFRLRSRVFDIDPPHGFRDRQISGPFSEFLHVHSFTKHPQGTLMRDEVAFRSPLGPVGRVVDRLFMRRYLLGVIRERNRTLMAELSHDGDSKHDHAADSDS